MSTSDFDQAIERYHQALSEFPKGNSAPVLKIFSERDDISLANPLGPAVRGRMRVVETAEHAAMDLRDGITIGFENLVKVVTSDLAFIVETERYKSKVAGRQDLSPITLRVTTVFRLEDGAWRIVHRHADPIVVNLPAESQIEK